MILFLLLALPLCAELRVQKIFGPETDTGPYKHPAAITELDNGDLLLVYYGGKGEYARDTALFMSRLAKGSSKWTPPRRIAQDPFRSLGNGVLWQAPDNVVWLFYVVRFGDTWTNSRIAQKISHDRGETWSDASMLTLEEGMMVRNKPIVLANGDYLLPAYRETGNDTEFIPPDTTSVFFRFDKAKREWKKSGEIRSAKGNLQPAVVELEPNHLVAYCRRGGDYKPTQDGWLVRSESKNGGVTWSEGVNSAFRNPHAAVELLKLRNGHLLMIFNDHMSDRTPLAASVSTDNDRTWTKPVNLMEGRNSFAYPSAVEGRDGRIHLVFTSDGRKVIQYATFQEADVLRR